MNAFVSAETIADAVACLREAGTPLPAAVADLDDVALGRALWRMNADALTVNHDDEIEGYAAPAASDSAAQRVKSLAYLMQQCCAGDAEGDPLEQELFMTLYEALWTATCKMTGTDEDEYEAVAGGEDWDAATPGRNEQPTPPPAKTRSTAGRSAFTTARSRIGATTMSEDKKEWKDVRDLKLLDDIKRTTRALADLMNSLEYWTLVNGDMQQAVYRMDDAYCKLLVAEKKAEERVALRVSASAKPPPGSP